MSRIFPASDQLRRLQPTESPRLLSLSPRPASTMSRVLWQGVRPLSWTRVVSPRARRCIQIRAAASEQPAGAQAHLPNSVESRGMSAQSIIDAGNMLTTKECRRAVRCHRRSAFAPFGFVIRIAEPLYATGDVGGIEWQGRQCTIAYAYGSKCTTPRELLTVASIGCLYAEGAGTFPTSRRRRAVSLPEGLI